MRKNRLLVALALLVCNTAAGLASRLAGGLALAASAVLSALAKVLCLNSLDMLHYYILRRIFTYEIIPYHKSVVNRLKKICIFKKCNI